MTMSDEELRKSRKILNEDKVLNRWKRFEDELERKRIALRDITEKYFPGKYRILEACLSVKALELIEGITLPFCLVLIGEPSGGKSTILYIVKSLGECYLSDSFTAKSFVTHIATESKRNLDQIDLLPKIENKMLITPELAPLFSSRDEKLLETIGILTRILDGKGYQSDSGVHGRRGYDRDIFFTWLGAVVEIPSRVWTLIGYSGPKMYFLRIPEDKSSEEEKREKILAGMNDISYNAKLSHIEKLAKSLWETVKVLPKPNKGKILWDRLRDDQNVLEKIVILAQVLGRLRAYLPTRDTAHTSGSNYGYEKPIIEDPARAANSLYNLAKGHAIFCGRNYITKEDLTVVIDVALSSASRDRIGFFEILIENAGLLTTVDIMEKLKVNNDTALRKMREFEILGLVEKVTVAGNTKPFTAISLKKEYRWLLSEEFKLLWKDDGAIHSE